MHLAYPLKPSRTASSVWKPASAAGCSSDCISLNPDVDESSETGTDDSAYEQWKQHKYRSPFPRGTHIPCGVVD